ncbi:MAG: hypothetical protein HKL90_15605, partial [Elusimicrobia bacterium]|nr:hypothetical protein [Elusimicrobiota bacterium]
MRRHARGFMVAAALGALAALGWGWRRVLVRHGARLRAGRAEYLHYDLVDLRLETRDPALDARLRAAPPRVVVTRGGADVTTVAGIRELTLARTAPGVWIARWPVPWNASTGEYAPRLVGGADLGDRLRVAAFRIGRRTPIRLPPGFVAATLETVRPLATMRVTAPDGTRGDWRGLLDWARYLRADAFWMLGGQSPGEGGAVWNGANVARIPEVARECRARGLKFGVYVEYSLTMSTSVKLSGDEYAREIVDGRAVVTRAISLRDARRPADVAAFLKPFADDPYVDFVGLDYIRNALGGDELVDDFVAEMPGVSVPKRWKRLTRTERMTWLARKRILRQDAAFVDAWQWWRARRAALIVREIKERLATDKPLWAFTLTWDKGRQ